MHVPCDASADHLYRLALPCLQFDPEAKYTIASKDLEKLFLALPAPLGFGGKANRRMVFAYIVSLELPDYDGLVPFKDVCTHVAVALSAQKASRKGVEEKKAVVNNLKAAQIELGTLLAPAVKAELAMLKGDYHGKRPTSMWAERQATLMFQAAFRRRIARRQAIAELKERGILDEDGTAVDLGRTADTVGNAVSNMFGAIAEKSGYVAAPKTSALLGDISISVPGEQTLVVSTQRKTLRELRSTKTAQKVMPVLEGEKKVKLLSADDAEAELAADKAARKAKATPGLTPIERIRMVERARAKSKRQAIKRKKELQAISMLRYTVGSEQESPQKLAFGDPNRIPKSVKPRRASQEQEPLADKRDTLKPRELKARFEDSDTDSLDITKLLMSQTPGIKKLLMSRTPGIKKDEVLAAPVLPAVDIWDASTTWDRRRSSLGNGSPVPDSLPKRKSRAGKRDADLETTRLKEKLAAAEAELAATKAHAALASAEAELAATKARLAYATQQLQALPADQLHPDVKAAISRVHARPSRYDARRQAEQSSQGRSSSSSSSSSSKKKKKKKKKESKKQADKRSSSRRRRREESSDEQWESDSGTATESDQSASDDDESDERREASRGRSRSSRRKAGSSHSKSRGRVKVSKKSRSSSRRQRSEPEDDEEWEAADEPSTPSKSRRRGSSSSRSRDDL